MLHCLVNRIPVIMPGWIDFGWNQALKDVPGIYLAPGSPELEERVKEWLSSAPSMSKEVAEYFVQSPRAGQALFRSMVNDLINQGRANRNDLLRAGEGISQNSIIMRGR